MTIVNWLAHQRGTLLSEDEVPGSVTRRRARVGEPHVAPLEALSRSIADRTGEAVPSFDPRSAGVHAQALFLLQDPSRVAAHGSRFTSPDNNDQTAHNCTKAYEASGLDYGRVLHWNVVPWWVEDPARRSEPGRSLPAQARRARPHLLELIALLKRLEVVVLLGRHAQQGWAAAGVEGLPVLRCPHPGAQAWNMLDRETGRPNRDLTVEAFAEVARILG